MPHIQMTRTAKIALYVLRIYLIVLLTLTGIKFVRTFLATNKAPPSPPSAPSPALEGRGAPLREAARCVSASSPPCGQKISRSPSNKCPLRLRTVSEY